MFCNGNCGRQIDGAGAFAAAEAPNCLRNLIVVHHYFRRIGKRTGNADDRAYVFLRKFLRYQRGLAHTAHTNRTNYAFQGLSIGMKNVALQKLFGFLRQSKSRCFNFFTNTIAAPINNHTDSNFGAGNLTE